MSITKGATRAFKCVERIDINISQKILISIIVGIKNNLVNDVVHYAIKRSFHTREVAI